jgi:hypothetical protein
MSLLIFIIATMDAGRNNRSIQSHMYEVTLII